MTVTAMAVSAKMSVITVSIKITKRWISFLDLILMKTFLQAVSEESLQADRSTDAVDLFQGFPPFGGGQQMPLIFKKRMDFKMVLSYQEAKSAEIS